MLLSYYNCAELIYFCNWKLRLYKKQITKNKGEQRWNTNLFENLGKFSKFYSFICFTPLWGIDFVFSERITVRESPLKLYKFLLLYYNAGGSFEIGLNIYFILFPRPHAHTDMHPVSHCCRYRLWKYTINIIMASFKLLN